jgi:CDP-paratose 2-epimerase
MSLAQLNDWCDERFGPHTPSADPTTRAYDVPWVVMDNSQAMRDFAWRIETPLPAILDGIAQHAHDHPDWLEVSGV